MKELSLNKTPDKVSQQKPASSDLLKYFDILRGRRPVVIAGLVGGFLAALLYNFFSTPVYEAQVTLMYEQPQEAAFLDFEQGFPRSRSTLINTVSLAKSRAISSDVVRAMPEELRARIKTPHPLPSGYTREKAIVEKLREKLQVSVIPGSDILQLRMQAPDGFMAKTIANIYAEKIIDWKLHKKRQALSSVRKFVENQLSVLQGKLNTAEEEMRAFKEQHSMLSLADASGELLTKMTEAEASYNTVKSERLALENRRHFISAKLKELSPSISLASSNLADDLKKQLTDLNAQYARRKAEPVEEGKERLASLEQNIQDVRDQLTRELLQDAKKGNLLDPYTLARNLLQEYARIEVDLEAYRARENGLAKILKNYEAKIKKLPAQELKLARLIRTRDVNAKIYSMLLEKLEEARISEAGKIGDIHLIDAAEAPATPVKPAAARNSAAGLFLGLLLGVGLAFVLESVDTTLKSQDDVENVLELPVMAMIPTIASNGINGVSGMLKRSKPPTLASAYQKKLIHHADKNSLLREAFNSLQLNFAFANADRELRTILVTSAGPQEGKTLTAINMAMTFAGSGVKTLLVDCDLRRPLISRILDIDKEPGLSNFLGNNADLGATIHYLEEENIWVLPSGSLPPNPSEVLNSQAMRDLLASFKNEYDFIIIDSPPVISATDSIVLSTEVDGVLLVVKSGKTNQEIAIRAKQLLERGQAKIIGTVLNDINLKKLYRNYKDYFDYYSHAQPHANGMPGSALFRI